MSISVERLCTLGDGKKLHIRRTFPDTWVLCSLGRDFYPFTPPDNSVGVAVQETFPGLCKTCLKSYRGSEG